MLLSDLFRYPVRQEDVGDLGGAQTQMDHADTPGFADLTRDGNYEPF